MRDKIKLYLDRQKNYYIVSQDIVSCDKCSCELTNLFVLTIDWSKKKSYMHLTCTDCAVDVQKYGELYEAKYGVVTSEIMPDFIPVIIRPPDTREGRPSSVFDAAEFDSDVTYNKTVYAGRLSLEGASVGKSVEEIESQSNERLEIFERKLLGDGKK